MDEPFGALDAMTRDALHTELETLVQEQGLTVLFVTHNVREAARLGDRIVVLSPRPGRVTATFDVEITPSAPHRFARGQHARRHRHRTAPGGGARPCSSLTPTRPRSPTSPTRRFSTTARRSPIADATRRAGLGRRVWTADVAEGGRRRPRPLPVAARRVVGLEAGVHPPRSGRAAFDRLGELIADGTVAEAISITMQRAAVGFALALVIGVARRQRGRVVEDRPLRGRRDDHRSADDALDRLVPARHRAVRALRAGDHCSSSCSARRPRSPTG